MPMNPNRYKIIDSTRHFGEEKGFSVIDKFYPILHFPFFQTRREAEEYIASKYEMTLEEYKQWKRNLIGGSENERLYRKANARGRD